MNSNISEIMVASGGGVLQEVTLRAKLILRLFFDKRVNLFIKIIPVLGLIYWISPVDLIIGIPGIDAIDDLAVLWLSQYIFLEFCPTDVVHQTVRELISNNKMVNQMMTKTEDVIDGQVVEIENPPTSIQP